MWRPRVAGRYFPRVANRVGNRVVNEGLPHDPPHDLPHVENSVPPHVAATRGKSPQLEENTDSYSESAGEEKSCGETSLKPCGDNPKIDAVKASKNTWAFRVRWIEPDGSRPVVYLYRVSDPVYRMIRKGNYAAFKKQLISGYQSAIRADQ